MISVSFFAFLILKPCILANTYTHLTKALHSFRQNNYILNITKYEHNTQSYQKENTRVFICKHSQFQNINFKSISNLCYLLQDRLSDGTKSGRWTGAFFNSNKFRIHFYSCIHTDVKLTERK